MTAHSENPCDDCGLCCLAFSLPPYDANELVKAPEALIERIEHYANGPRHRDDYPCLWLDLETGKCRHHKVRPVLCRWFEPGCDACNEIRQKSGLQPLAVL